jgi:hypothetical protein
VNTFDWRSERCPDAHPPATITTSQATAIGQRNLIAALVQASTTAALLR